MNAMPAAREALRARSTPIRATRHTADPTVRRHPVPAGTCGHTDHAMAYRSPAGAGSPSGIAPGHALGTVPVGPRPSRSAVALPLDTARRTAFGIASGDGGSPRPWAENDDGRTKPVPDRDLGNVHIHDDDRPAALVALLGDAGLAFGDHIALGPSSADGPSRDWLMAHEVTHVMQQRAGRAGMPGSADPEREADRSADLIQSGDPSTAGRILRAAPTELAEKVIARHTQDLAGNLMLIIDVDDGDFVGGCVRQIVPHLGVKIVMKGVPKGVGNQLFNMHIGVVNNADGEACVFFYESVTGLCEFLCFPTLEELGKKLDEIRNAARKIESVLQAILPALVATVIAAVIAYAIVAAIVAAGLVVAAA